MTKLIKLTKLKKIIRQSISSTTNFVNKRKWLLFLTGFIVIGLTYLVLSKAATNFADIEPETKTVASPAEIINDSTASKLKAVKFKTSGTAVSPSNPEKMAIYYGDPARVNTANGNTSAAADIFRAYDMVIFGEGIEQSSSSYHTPTQTIIQNIAPTTRSYGYVDMCVENPQSSLYRCSNFSAAELKSRVDKWKAMGAKGIFLDQAGCEYVVNRERLNTIVDYIHSQNLSAFANIWNVPEAFEPGSLPSPYSGYADCNPGRTATKLDSRDYVLLESWAVILSDWSENYAADPNSLKRRGSQMLGYKAQYGTKVATVNTIGYNNPPFNQQHLNYTWWATKVYGFDAMAWGETWVFSSDTNSLPFRTRPNVNTGNNILPLSVTVSGNLIKRTTSSGTIQLDTNAHTGSFN